jgi:hypothetical protein
LTSLKIMEESTDAVQHAFVFTVEAFLALPASVHSHTVVNASIQAVGHIFSPLRGTVIIIPVVVVTKKNKIGVSFDIVAFSDVAITSYFVKIFFDNITRSDLCLIK